MRLKEQLKRLSLYDIVTPFIFLILLPFMLIHRFFIKVVDKKIILISEDPTEARDNGYVFYRYLVDKKNIPNVYYVITKTSPDRNKFKKKDQVIDFYSFQHWFYYFNAYYNISVHKASSPAPAVFYLLQKYRLFNGNRVFLQHGVIMNDIPYLHQEECNFTYFITSSPREYKFVKETLGYDNSVLKLLGLPRHDLLERTAHTDGDYTIAIMPTWRKFLDKSTSEQFQKSEYFKAWNEVLDYLRYNEYFMFERPVVFYFYLHRNFIKYANLFGDSSSTLKILVKEDMDIQDLIQNSDALITDYSSISMDFAYSNRPIIYYQFDQETFHEKHLSRGYFDYEKDGFGPVCLSKEKLYCELEELLKNPVDFSNKYLLEVNTFFAYRDGKNSERIYELLFKECENGKH